MPIEAVIYIVGFVIGFVIFIANETYCYYTTGNGSDDKGFWFALATFWPIALFFGVLFGLAWLISDGIPGVISRTIEILVKWSKHENTN